MTGFEGTREIMCLVGLLPSYLHIYLAARHCKRLADGHVHQNTLCETVGKNPRKPFPELRAWMWLLPVPVGIIQM